MNEIGAFRDVLGGAPCPITWEEVRMSYILCILADRAFRENRVVNVQEEMGSVE